MRKMTTAVLSLTLLLSLTGCNMIWNTPSGGLPAKSAGISASKTLLTVDGREIPAWQYLYWLSDTCDSIRDAYAAAGTELRWDAPLEESLEEDPEASGETSSEKIPEESGEISSEKTPEESNKASSETSPEESGEVSDETSQEKSTLGTYAKEQALRSVTLYATVENWAETYGCVLTEEDQAAIESDWTEKSEEYGGEEAYLSALKDKGLDRPSVEILSKDYYLYQHLWEVFQTKGSPLYSPETEVSDFAIEKGYRTIDFIRVSAEAYPDEKARRTRAEEVYGKLNASTSPIQDFVNLAASYSNDPNRAEHPSGCTFTLGDGILPAEAEAASQGLEPNQWSGIIQASDGDYILLCRPLSLEDVRQTYFDYKIQTAADQAELELTDTYHAIQTDHFYRALESTRASNKKQDTNINTNTKPESKTNSGPESSPEVEPKSSPESNPEAQDTQSQEAASS